LETNSIEEIFNEYVKINTTIKYDEQKIEEITGITRETCEKKGKPLIYVLNKFYMAYLRADCVVAHNMEFDRKMIQIELLRNNLMFRMPMFHPESRKREECTMVMSLKLCNIVLMNKWGKPYTKNPKLSETYHHLFGIVPEQLHNAIMDTIYCLRCYLKMQHGIEIPGVLFSTWGYE
jgi:DNA polymerase-3 subunit alpha